MFAFLSLLILCISLTDLLYPFSYLINLCDEVAEWLRRWTANPMGSARVGSNPILVGNFEKKIPLPGIEPGPPG